MIVTPCVVDDLARLGQLAVAALLGRQSTMTLPVFIDRTMSAVISFGAGLPGISAVVMMMSTSVACSAKSAISALMNSGLITLA